MTPEELSPIFEAHLGVAVVQVQRAAVGNGQEVWLVDATGGSQYVLRRTATGGTLEWTDRAAEFAVLRRLADAGLTGVLPIPEALWFEADGGALERAYFVMRRLPGRPFGTGSADVNPAIAAQIGTLLARLHNATRERGSAREPTVAELTAIKDRYRGVEAQPVIDALIDWLDTNLPADLDGTVQLWGDAGPHNILVDGDRITGLLDWELARRGHPFEDVGAAVWACLGMLSPALVVRAYEAEAGPVDRGALAWFEVLAEVSRSVMTLAGAQAFVEQRNLSPNLAALGRALVNTTLLRAARAAWGIDIDAAIAAAHAGRDPDPERAALAAFLLREVAPHVADRRAASGLKIAAALVSAGAPPRLQRAGAPPAALVAALADERVALAPLLALYGPTTAFPEPLR